MKSKRSFIKAARGEIPVKTLKSCGCMFDILKNCINQTIEIFNFLDCLKPPNITPVFKKDYPLDKLNYRPVSILPLFSKVYKRFIYNQLYKFTENKLNSIICACYTKWIV